MFLFHNSKMKDVIGFGVLPATRSLLAGNGLALCTTTLAETPGNPICFHSARMPVAEIVVGAGITLFGDHPLPISLFKTLLLLIPLQLAAYLVCCRLVTRVQLSTIVLILPFLIVPFLWDVVSLPFEEAYSYSLIALTVTVALFWPKSSDVTSGLLFGLCAALIYIVKSSMAPVAVVLLIACLTHLKGRTPILVALAIALSAPLGWVLYQHGASGRYTFGTSLDGLNLHNGNSEHFLRDYPPHRSLDDTAAQLNAGHYFPDEWTFNDYHRDAAIRFITTHPGDTLRGDLRKLRTMLFSVQEIGHWSHTGLFLLADTGGMILFRILFWIALPCAAWLLVTGRFNARRQALIYLSFVVAVCVPYVAGFAYTRHVSVLIYPTAVFCCLLLQLTGSPETSGTSDELA